MRLTGGQIVAEFLAKAEVPYLIGIPGHGCLGLIDAFKGRTDIRVLPVRQEMSAVHMADGYYRVTGRPLAVFTSIGPGAMNTVIGVATAYVDSTAVLVLTGSTHTYMRGRGVLQEIERQHDANFPQVLAPIVKRYWRVDAVQQLPTIMQRAFNEMLSGRPGPVLIDLPMDVQANVADVEIPDPQTRIPQGRIMADSERIKKAVELLMQARRPVILAGGGVVGAMAWEELRQLAELLGAPVTTTMMGRGVFPEDHPLSIRIAGSTGTECGNSLTASADVLLAIGCRFADRASSSYKKGASYAIPPTRLIHIDIDAGEIGKNFPAEVGIVADIKAALGQILEELQRHNYRVDYQNTSYFQEIQERKTKWYERIDVIRNSTMSPPTISRVLKQVRDFLDDDAYVISSSGHSQDRILQEFPFRVPRANITTGGFSTMGFTLPASLGVKLADPSRQVLGVVGDGDFMMTMQELATAVELQIPVVTLILNNQGWVSIRDLQIGALGKDRTLVSEFKDSQGKPYSPDFAAIALAFGCHAEKISRYEEVIPALQSAFKSGRPAVVEVIVNREFPHSGGPVTGWWDVPIPAYLEERRREYEAARAGEVLF
jgi:acetolactate synthase-1/2/3 large subunit